CAGIHDWRNLCDGNFVWAGSREERGASRANRRTERERVVRGKKTRASGATVAAGRRAGDGAGRSVGGGAYRSRIARSDATQSSRVESRIRHAEYPALWD